MKARAGAEGGDGRVSWKPDRGSTVAPCLNGQTSAVQVSSGFCGLGVRPSV